MLKVNPYINLDGKTEEAFNFYKSVFGGEFSSINKFKDMPAGEQPMPAEEANRIMHIALPLSDTITLMGSDTAPSMGHTLTLGNNVYISLHTDTIEEAQRLFNALSDQGQIEMPLEKMFWGAYFSSFSDKYGIKWMINFEG